MLYLVGFGWLGLGLGRLFSASASILDGGRGWILALTARALSHFWSLGRKYGVGGGGFGLGVLFVDQFNQELLCQDSSLLFSCISMSASTVLAPFLPQRLQLRPPTAALVAHPFLATTNFLAISLHSL